MALILRRAATLSPGDQENVAYLLDSLCDISHNAAGEQDGPKRLLNVR